jgi:hypothetical protein
VPPERRFSMGLFRRQQPETYIIAGRKLQCTICEHDRFLVRDAQLNTSILTFLGFDWLNKSGRCYICDKCGYIHWFVPTRDITI